MPFAQFLSLIFVFYAHANNSCSVKISPQISTIVEIKQALHEKLAPQITGEYSNNAFRQTCALQYEDSTDHQVYNCSATLLPGNQKFLTSAHCKFKPNKTRVSCSCGKTSTTSYIVKAPMIHPSVTEYELSYDIQLGILDQAIKCPNPNQNPAPLHLPKDLETAKKLIKLGDCYFSGAGLGNDGKTGEVHTTHVPLQYIFLKSGNRMDYIIPDATLRDLGNSTNEMIQYQSVASTRTKLATLVSFINAMTKAKIPISNGTSFYRPLEDSLKREEMNRALIPLNVNSSEHGDSGGSLICRDSKKKPYLIGIITNAFQEVTLISDLQIETWLKKSL